MRRTYDGAAVRVLASGDLVDGGLRPFTRHRALDVPTALLVAEEAMLFDAAELPALIEAAHRLTRRSPRGVLPGALRALASRLSTRAWPRLTNNGYPTRASSCASFLRNRVDLRLRLRAACMKQPHRALARKQLSICSSCTQPSPARTLASGSAGG